MRTHLSLLQGALILLLIATGILFVVGSTIERQDRGDESHAGQGVEVGTGESEGESHAEGSEPSGAEQASEETGVRILGVDTESLAATILALVASLVLAAAVWLRPVKLVFLAVVVFALLFAAGDGRELSHQLDESNSGIATIAAVLLALHVAIAALAAVAGTRRGGTTPVSSPQSAS